MKDLYSLKEISDRFSPSLSEDLTLLKEVGDTYNIVAILFIYQPQIAWDWGTVGSFIVRKSYNF